MFEYPTGLLLPPSLGSVAIATSGNYRGQALCTLIFAFLAPCSQVHQASCCERPCNRGPERRSSFPNTDHHQHAQTQLMNKWVVGCTRLMCQHPHDGHVAAVTDFCRVEYMDLGPKSLQLKS